MPGTASKRATIYFDAKLHAALRLKAAESERSISDIVNEAVREAFNEDLDDLAACRDRIEEPSVSYGVFLEQLKEDGAL